MKSLSESVDPPVIIGKSKKPPLFICIAQSPDRALVVIEAPPEATAFARTATDVLVRFLDDAGDEVANLTHVATGELRLVDAAGTTVVTTSSTPFAADGVFYFVEVRWQHSASGALDVHVDGVSEINETGVDLTDGGGIGADAAVYRLVGSSANQPVFDDLYMYSGGTGTGDFLGDASVFRYQANTNSATPDAGNDLDQGVWQDLGETPVSSDATDPAYTGGVLAGEVYSDDILR